MLVVCCFVDCGERGASGSLEVGDEEIVKEVLSCSFVDSGERGSKFTCSGR